MKTIKKLSDKDYDNLSDYNEFYKLPLDDRIKLLIEYFKNTKRKIYTILSNKDVVKELEGNLKNLKEETKKKQKRNKKKLN